MNAVKLIPTSLTLLVLVFHLSVPADTGEEVRQAEQKWVKAVTAKDRSALEKILAEDLVYTHSTGLVENRTQYLTALSSGQQKYTSIDYSDTVVRSYGSTAVVTTEVRMTGTTKGEPFDSRLRMIHVWFKNGSGWTLVAHQTTRLP
ncbi:MAG: nuclear transport factor 2 family protein [Acidobacteriota bacterium]